MASLYEYFVKDGTQNLTAHEVWPLTTTDGQKLGELTARLHFDFEANAKYISFYFPRVPEVDLPEALALKNIDEILLWPETKMEVSAGSWLERKSAKELVFTGQIYLYSERPIPDPVRGRLLNESKRVGHTLTFRSVEYMEERNKWEKPRAFISHDSRDKVEMAEPLAVYFQKMMCPVWYDQFSLRVGDSLRESIEQGLKDSPKCVLLLTPNFLTNSGWSRREYDSIFTRELVEKRRVILPVWHQVTSADVYQYSPILADRVAVQWSLGVAEVARQLLRVMDD